MKPIIIPILPRAILFVSLFFSLTQFQCNISDPEPEDNIKMQSLKGKVYELTEEGEQPSVDAEVVLFLTESTLSSITDNEGIFEFEFDDTVQSVSIRVTKPERTQLDTILLLIDKLYIELTIVQLIEYFPLNENNTWLYVLRSYLQGGGYETSYDGIETWTIISYNGVSRSGMMQCDFEGTRYQTNHTENTSDTANVSGSQIFNLTIEDNVIFIEPVGDATGYPPRTRQLYGITGGELFQVYYPLGSPDTIEYSIGYKEPRTYILERGVGFRKIFAGNYGVIDYAVSFVINEYNVHTD